MGILRIILLFSAFTFIAFAQSPVYAQAPEDAQQQSLGTITKNPSIRVASQPVYPPLALQSRKEAVVVLQLTIADDGRVDSTSIDTITITSESGMPLASPSLDDEFGFAHAALLAGNQLEFTPAEVDGKPVSVSVSYTYRFTLPKPAKAKPLPTPAQGAPTAEVETAAVVNFEGVFVERGTRSFVPAVKITVYRGESDALQGYEATTDAQGRYAFYDLTPGEWTVSAEKPGYLPYTTKEKVIAGLQTSARYYLERGSYNAYDVTIEAAPPRKEVIRRSLRKADIEKIPGTLGDPVLVVENLPGVARRQGGEILVRGSSPNDTRIYIDGALLPRIYHFGGLKSVLPAKTIESIDFYPGNFSVAFGRGMGGVLDLHMSKLNPDRFHGSIDLSILDTSLYFEAPISDTLAIGVSGRRSYIGTILKAIVPEGANRSYSVAPRYYDYQFFGRWRPAQAHDFRWLLLGSDDAVEQVFKDPSGAASIGATSNALSFGTSFQRLSADYRYTPNAKVKNRLKLSVGRDALDFDYLGALGSKVNYKLLSLRNTLSYRIAEGARLHLGIDMEAVFATGRILLPPPPREDKASNGFDREDIREATFAGEHYVYAAPFVEGEIKLANLTLVPGVRIDYLGLTKTWTVDPRLVARYDFGHWALQGGAAVVHQDPSLPDSNEVFGNPDLDPLRAYQYSLGGEWTPLEHIKANVTLFYKEMHNIVTTSNRLVERDGKTTPEKLANDGRGRVFGAEFFLEHRFANNLRGWLSYTLSRAERRNRPGEEYRLYNLDQTHILAIVASYLLPQNWEVGLRWRYVTGNLETPIVDSFFDNTRNRYIPIRGEVNSARFPDFHQLDLRVDKTWVLKTWKVSAYLSLVNSYNRSNIERVDYNFDYSERSNRSGQALLPIVGIKGEW